MLLLIVIIFHLGSELLSNHGLELFLFLLGLLGIHFFWILLQLGTIEAFECEAWS